MLGTLTTVGLDVIKNIGNKGIQDQLDSDLFRLIGSEDVSVERIEALVRLGANTRSQNKYGYTPLHTAAYLADPDKIQVLLKYGAYVDARVSYCFSWSLSVNLFWFRHWFWSKIYCNASGVPNWTPLHLAVCRVDFDVFYTLVNAGADINRKMEGGWAPLHIAVNSANSEIVQALLNVGAEVNIQSKFGWTPLHGAVQEANIDMVRILIDAGADVNITARLGWTPLHIAKRHEDPTIANMLRYAGAEEKRRSLLQFLIDVVIGLRSYLKKGD